MEKKRRYDKANIIEKSTYRRRKIIEKNKYD